MSGDWEWTPTDMTDVPVLASGGGPWPPNLSEFTLQRVAEDEARWRMLGTVESMSATADFLLAECEAKRRIVLSMGDVLRAWDALPNDTEETDPIRFEALTGAANLAESVLRELASIHAAHPDYDESWRP